MKVAHIGSLGGNAYLNAKFQRQYSTIEADCYVYAGGAVQFLPEWEDAKIDTTLLAGDTVLDWGMLQFVANYQRPSWVKVLGVRPEKPVLDTPTDVWDEWTDTSDPLPMVLRRPAQGLSSDDLCHARRGAVIEAIAREYDLVVLYGPEAMHGLALPVDKPYITFECSTMRLVDRRDTPGRRLLSEAYLLADHNLITNADCQRTAQRLGLSSDRYSFMPHPVDIYGKFAPTGEQRKQNSDPIIFLAPARQARHLDAAPKNNDVILDAFTRYVKEAVPRGFPPATLMLLLWGEPEDVTRTKERIHALGIADYVMGFPLMPKWQYAMLVQQCDVVLDQFDTRVGSYGTCTIEGLACGKPVITHWSMDAHGWCRDYAPLITLPATDADGVYGWMVECTLASLAQAHGESGREWVEATHRPEQIVARHQDVYEKVLSR